MRLPHIVTLLASLLLGMPAAHGSGHYVLELGKPVTAQQARNMRAALKRNFAPVIRGREVYQVRARGRDPARYIVKIGFFSEVEEVYAVRRQLRRSFPNATVAQVSAAEVASLRPVAATPVVARNTPTQVASEEVEKRAARLIRHGREALTRGDNEGAVRLFNELLNLPPNSYSQDAQEYVGLARERSGQIAKARTEYTLYLKLYPQGEGAERVRQRLANLEAAGARTVDLRAPKKKSAAQWITYGGLSQYYYRGDFVTDITSNTATTTSQSSVSDTDQSMLATHIDVTSRYRSDHYDVRAVLRAMNQHDFLDTDHNRDRLNSAYVDLKDRQYDYGVRLGRQPGNFGGILGYFDGGWLGYTFYPKWRFNVVGGAPFDPYTDYDKTFYGANFELGPFYEHWSANVYTLEQEVEGYTDREAVGAELRYFDEKRSLLGLVDYDLYFDDLNIAMLQGSVIRGAYTFSGLADHRRTPSLQLTNALQDTNLTSIAALRTTLSEEGIRQQALARTGTIDMGVVGVTWQLSKTWAVGGDVTVADVSSAPATPPSSSNPDGRDYTYTARAIATGWLAGADVTTLSVSYMDYRTSEGVSLALAERAILRRVWTIDALVRYTKQQDNFGGESDTVIPSAKVSYRLRDRVTFEAEAGVDQRQSAGVMQQEETTRHFYSIGYRWDF